MTPSDDNSGLFASFSSASKFCGRVFQCQEECELVGGDLKCVKSLDIPMNDLSYTGGSDCPYVEPEE